MSGRAKSFSPSPSPLLLLPSRLLPCYPDVLFLSLFPVFRALSGVHIGPFPSSFFVLNSVSLYLSAVSFRRAACRTFIVMFPSRAFPSHCFAVLLAVLLSLSFPAVLLSLCFPAVLFPRSACRTFIVVFPAVHSRRALPPCLYVSGCPCPTFAVGGPSGGSRISGRVGVVARSGRLNYDGFDRTCDRFDRTACAGRRRGGGGR